MKRLFHYHWNRKVLEMEVGKIEVGVLKRGQTDYYVCVNHRYYNFRQNFDNQKHIWQLAHFIWKSDSAKLMNIKCHLPGVVRVRDRTCLGILFYILENKTSSSEAEEWRPDTFLFFIQTLEQKYQKSFTNGSWKNWKD